MKASKGCHIGWSKILLYMMFTENDWKLSSTLNTTKIQEKNFSSLSTLVKVGNYRLFLFFIYE